MIVRLLALLIVLSSCTASQPHNINDGRIATMNDDLLVQKDRIIELERMITELNQRVEKVEFIYLEKRDQIVSEKTSAPLPEITDASTAITSEVPSLNTRISNRTSTIIPLNTLKEDRLSLDQFDINSIESKNFEFAFAHLEQNQFANAWRALEELTSLPLNSAWKAKLLFWKAICFEAMREEKKAISLYSELQANFPKEDRASLALLRQASLFTRLNEKELAKLTLSKLIKDYPRSSEANLAKERLKEMR